MSNRVDELAALMKKGSTLPEAAKAMGILPSTARTYLYAARQTSGVKKVSRKKLTNGKAEPRVNNVTFGYVETQADGRLSIVVTMPVAEIGSLLQHIAVKYG